MRQVRRLPTFGGWKKGRHKKSITSRIRGEGFPSLLPPSLSACRSRRRGEASKECKRKDSGAARLHSPGESEIISFLFLPLCFVFLILPCVPPSSPPPDSRSLIIAKKKKKKFSCLQSPSSLSKKKEEGEENLSSRRRWERNRLFCPPSPPPFSPHPSSPAPLSHKAIPFVAAPSTT